MTVKPEEMIKSPSRAGQWIFYLFNTFGERLRKSGRKVGDAHLEYILRKAMKKAGVNTITDDTFIQALRILVNSGNNQSSLMLSGRLLFRGLLIHRVANRLQIDAMLKANPSVIGTSVEKPIFIAALPRTGTTLMHRLFAQDKSLRAPLFWEMQYPCPSQNKQSRFSATRLDRVERELSLLDRFIPRLKSIHEVGANLPEECLMLFANDLISDFFLVFFHLPEYEAWLSKQDLRYVYERHKKQLQLLQLDQPDTTWVLKAPSHLRSLYALSRVYPDARIIQIHRDPSELVASTASLFSEAWSFSHTPNQRGAVGEIVLKRLAHIVNQNLLDRQKMLSDKRHDYLFIDVHYLDLLNNPMDTMRRIYMQCDLPWSFSVEKRMDLFLKGNPQHKHGKHKYTLEQFGLTKQKVTSHFSDYCTHFLKKRGG